MIPAKQGLKVAVGAVAMGLLTALVAALGFPELYIEMAAFAGLLVVLPLCGVVVGTMVFVPLAIVRRLRWSLVPLGVVLTFVTADVAYGLSLGTRFARWNAARHWAAVEREAAAARQAP